MTMKINEIHAVHREDFKAYDTKTVRQRFLLQEIFASDSIVANYTHYDRFMVGGVMPVNERLVLEAPDLLKAPFFLHRRELGIINIGGIGTIKVDGTEYTIANKEAMYIGNGSESVQFASKDAQNPAKFYFNSSPAHARHDTKKITLQDANVLDAGAAETCNQRSINQLLIHSVVNTCQLQMGMTELHPGSNWNTMPAHTHSRRMETYFYFNVPQEQAVCHFMGPPQETRHIWVANEQAVVSPPWSIHCGVGTANYTFIWGMAGENMDYTDMDFVKPNELK